MGRPARRIALPRPGRVATLKPGHWKLLEDMRSGLFEVVADEAPDRLCRDQEHVALLFSVATNLKHRARLMTAYVAGLRTRELGRSKISDIDSLRIYLRIDQGKSNKNRYIPLHLQAARHRELHPPSRWRLRTGLLLGGGTPTGSTTTITNPPCSRNRRHQVNIRFAYTSLHRFRGAQKSRIIPMACPTRSAAASMSRSWRWA